MTALIIATLQFLIAGGLATLLIDPSLRGRRLVGYAFLLGGGFGAFLLLAFSLVGIGWSVVTVSLTWAGAVGTMGYFLWRRRPVFNRSAACAAVPALTGERMLAVLVDALTVVLVGAHAVFAASVAGQQWDFWAIWGLKGRVFFEHRGLDWRFLEHAYNSFSHPDYPLLVPLDFVWMTLPGDGWNERSLGMLTTCFGGALLLIVRDLFGEELRRPSLAALATFATASFALSPWVGMAEGPFIALAGAALLALRHGLLREHTPSLLLGAVLLGLAAFTKNEGLGLLVAASVGAFLHLGRRWRRIVALWPAAVIAAPWLVLRAVHALPTYLTGGSMVGRARDRLGDLPALFATLADYPPEEPLFWVAAALALAVVPAALLRRERLLLGTVLIQLLFYIGAYVVTPFSLRWHVETSWRRLLDQLAVPLAFAVLATTGALIENAESAAETDRPSSDRAA